MSDASSTFRKPTNFARRCGGSCLSWRKGLTILPLLGRDLRSTSSQLTHHAAGQCAEELGQLVGMGILQGRLDQNGDAEYLDRVLQEQERNAPTGAMANDVFSPFGPPGLLDHIHGNTGTT